MSNQPGSRVPYHVSATGVQRALGERRMRRMAERGGHVDLDATMSGWPTPDPPSRPRAVVRPRRALPGAADRPAQPPVSSMVLHELAEHAPRPPAQDAPSARRRSRRLADLGTAGVVAGAAAAPAPWSAPAAPAPDPAFARPSSRPSRSPLPSPAPRSSVDPSIAVAEDRSSRGARGSWPPPSPGTADPFAPSSRSRPGALAPTRPAPPERPGPASARTAGDSHQAPGAPSVRPRSAPSRLPTPDPGPRMQPRAAAFGATWDVDPGEVVRPKRSRGLRRVVVAGAAVLVVVLVAALVIFFMRDPGGVTASLQPPSDAPRQQTVMAALISDDGSIAEASLLALDSQSLVALAMPGSMDVLVSDAGTVPLSGTLAVDPEAPDRGVEDTLGVRVDGTWVLTPTILSELIGETGGVVLDVPAAITVGDVTIPAGAQTRLNGAQAVAYAVAVVEGETVGAQSRFNQVLLGFLSQLPTDPVAVTQVISVTERDTGTTVTSELLSEVLAGAAARIQNTAATPALVPVAPRADGTAGVTVDVNAIAGLRDTSLAGATLPVAMVGPLRVAVQQGVDSPGLVTVARDRLTAAGLRYAGGGAVADLGVAESVILVAQDTTENRERGEAVADALGLPADALAVVSAGEDMGDVDIVVVLGQDFLDLTGSDQQ